MQPLLDLTLLRSFVAVAEKGSVTAAADAVHITQSALSLQIRKLEDVLGTQLLERHARGVRLTTAGELLHHHARLALQENDAAVERIRALSGRPRLLRLGARHDLLHPHVPEAMRRLADLQPETEVQMTMAVSCILKSQLVAGELDVILTTEFSPPPGGRLVATRQLVFIAAPGSDVWMRRPLPLGLVRGCLHNGVVQAALERAGISWVPTVESDRVRTVEVAVAAEKAVQAVISTARPPFLAPVRHGGALPDLPPVGIYLSVRDAATGHAALLADCLAESFASAADPDPAAQHPATH